MVAYLSLPRLMRQKNKALELVRNDFYARNVNDISGKYKCEYIVNQGGEFVLMVISSLFSGRN